MYKIKNVIGRSAHLTAAFSLLATLTASAILPATTFADELNPLTERSLMLSSSSPGYHYTDGSGNATYAGPGTGNNGLKTAETFSFLVSTNTTNTGENAKNTPIKAWTFQYCTTPAGDCTVPGNYSSDFPTESSNLNINYTTPAESTNNCSTGDYMVYTGGTDGGPDGGGTQSTGWSMETDRVADHDAAPKGGNNGSTSENNFIVLTHATGIQLAAGTRVWIKFCAHDTNYITNPGSGAFFVKVNNYSKSDYDGGELLPDTAENIIDGGVTVANVMNDSIWIQTKVLETMYFSVGTVNPDTQEDPDPEEDGEDPAFHGNCDAISVNEPLKMGDPTAEDSLSVTLTYDTHSYWRLSSNSSNGATVYYSGNTLANTDGDKIDDMQTKASSNPGSEQFGLAIDTTPDVLDDNVPAGGFSANTISPLVAESLYDSGAGTITDGGTAKFAFFDSSLSDPQPIATYDEDIIHCSTGKMRYIANIQPDTPAGVYTSKINYIADPQY